MRAGFFEVCDSVKQSTSPVRLLDSSQRGGNGVLPTRRNSVDILFFFLGICRGTIGQLRVSESTIMGPT